MAVVRSVGDRVFGVHGHDVWFQCLAGADQAATGCLATALAAVGLGTGLARLKSLGARPFCVGLVAAVLVGCASVCLVKGLGALG